MPSSAKIHTGMAGEEPQFFEDRNGHDSESEVDKPGPVLVSEPSIASKPVAAVEEDSTSKQEAPTPKDSTETSFKAVWVDDDDDEETVDLVEVPRRKKLRKGLEEKNISATEYAKRIRSFYKEKGAAYISGTGEWAELPSERRKREKQDDRAGDSGEEDDEEEVDDFDLSAHVRSLSRSAGQLLAKRKRAKRDAGGEPGTVTLRGGILNLRTLPHANEEDPNRAEARCVEFHPSGRIIFTAGLDKTLRLFMIDGEKSSKIQGIHVENFPIHSAHFTGGGKEIILTGRRKYFYRIDVDSGTVQMMHTLNRHEDKSWEKFEVSADGSKLAFLGQQGKIVLMSNTSKQEMGQLRHNSRVQSAAFAPAGACEHHLYSATEEGTVYLWDVRKMACVDMHKDEGAVHNSSIAVSPKHYALGSDSGVVNVYPSSELGNSKRTSIFGVRTPKPEKTFFNLRTEIDNISFNADGQVMTFSSHVKKDAVRIAHMPSMSVFKNWPSTKTSVRRVCKTVFSPGSGYMAIGNDKGDVHMLRLKDYAAR